MAMTQEQFEAKIKEVVLSSVNPLLESHGKTMTDSIAAEVDTKIKEILAETTKRISIHDNSDDDPKGGFKSLSHFARDVARMEIDRGKISKELSGWVTKAAGSGLSESDSDYGGVLIPPEFKNDLLLTLDQQNLILPRCTPVPMATNIVEIPYVQGFDESGGLVYGGIEWKWLDEVAALTETRPKFGKIQMKLKKVAGLAYTSSEILSDSPQSMEGILRQGFASGLNFQMNKVFMRGTGAGQPLGILNAPCLVSITAETGQAATTIVFENIIKMYARVSNAAGAIWMANPDCLPQLATMTLAVGTGGVPVFLPANGASGQPYDTLFGKPIIWNDHCSTVGTVGDIVLCDWSQYLIGQKSGENGVRFDTSIHLKFDYDQVAFRFIFRIDGQPWWPSALTTAQSAATRSPFIAVATRS